MIQLAGKPKLKLLHVLRTDGPSKGGSTTTRPSSRVLCHKRLNILPERGQEWSAISTDALSASSNSLYKNTGSIRRVRVRFDDTQCLESAEEAKFRDSCATQEGWNHDLHGMKCIQSSSSDPQYSI